MVIFDEAPGTECVTKNVEETGLTLGITFPLKGELAMETRVAPHPNPSP